MGGLGAGAPREVLPADGFRPAATCRRDRRVGADGERDCASAEVGVTPMNLRDWKLRLRALVTARRSRDEFLLKESFFVFFVPFVAFAADTYQRTRFRCPATAARQMRSHNSEKLIPQAFAD